jgi:2-C-methyl-D-erythritol 4-phosphate cytidylyltransferase
MGAHVPKVLLEVPDGEAGAKSTKTIIRKTVDIFASHPDCLTIVVCAPPTYLGRCTELLSGVSQVRVIAGGSTRQESVRLAVELLESMYLDLPEVPVLVHDAARCCVDTSTIARVLSGVFEFGAVTAGVRIVDAICRTDSGGRVVGYVAREGLWAVQTPQGFLLNDLTRAHREALRDGIVALDDAGLVARVRDVFIVQGGRGNIKVTEPEDLSLLRSL